MIDRFNFWYDQLEGGRRFGLFMLMMVCSVFLLHLGINMHNAPLMLIGLANTSVVVLIAASRAFGRGSIHPMVGAAMVGTMVFIFLAVMVLVLL